MNKIKKSFILFSAVVLFACQSGKTENAGKILPIDIKQSNELSEMLDSSYTYTILETCDEGLIGEISKIELTDDRIYLFDSRKNVISIFGKTGNFINQIKKIGQGPGEYTSLTDMVILNSDIYVLAGNRIIVYGEDGTWIKTIPLDTYYNHFHLINDSLLYLYSGKSNLTMYDFALFNYTTGSFVERFAPYKRTDSYMSRTSPFHKTDSKELLVIDEYDYNIYSLTDTLLEIGRASCRERV